jgi:uncharacterized protein YodC (DUF2158 family)
MSNGTFKKGDVVRLKSGGPSMTVDDFGNKEFGGGPLVFCSWFDADQKHCSKNFAPESLEIARPAGRSGSQARVVRG